MAFEIEENQIETVDDLIEKLLEQLGESTGGSGGGSGNGIGGGSNNWQVSSPQPMNPPPGGGGGGGGLGSGGTGTQSPTINKKFNIGIGKFRKRKIEAAEASHTGTLSNDIQEFGLYYKEKNIWLDKGDEIRNYFQPDVYHIIQLDFKRKMGDFKIKIKIFFPEYSIKNIFSISPSTTTVSDVRKLIPAWLLEEKSILPSLAEEIIEKLDFYGIYLHDHWLNESDKLHTLKIRAKDTLEIKQIPKYVFFITNFLNVTFTLSIPSNFTLSQFIVKLIETHYQQKMQKQFDSSTSFHVNSNHIKNMLQNHQQMLSNPQNTQNTRIQLQKIVSQYTMEVFNPTIVLHLQSNNEKQKLSTLNIDKDTMIQITSTDYEGIIIWNISVRQLASELNSQLSTSLNTLPVQEFLYHGEKVISQVIQNVTIFLNSKTKRKNNIKYFPIEGMITNFRVLFISPGTSNILVDCPITAISNVLKIKSNRKRNRNKNRKYCLDIHCKSIRIIKLGFQVASDRVSFYRQLLDLMNDHQESKLFAFYYTLAMSSPAPFWDIYQPKDEFLRFSVSSYQQSSHGWRLTSLNEHYNLCKSYPELIAVPATVSDDLITITAAFRTKDRLPALCWIHPVTGAPLCRFVPPIFFHFLFLIIILLFSFPLILFVLPLPLPLSSSPCSFPSSFPSLALSSRYFLSPSPPSSPSLPLLFVLSFSPSPFLFALSSPFFLCPFPFLFLFLFCLSFPFPLSPSSSSSLYRSPFPFPLPLPLLFIVPLFPFPCITWFFMYHLLVYPSPLPRGRRGREEEYKRKRGTLLP